VSRIFRTPPELRRTAIEYGLIATGIAAIVAIVPTIGTKLNTAFGKVSAALN